MSVQNLFRSFSLSNTVANRSSSSIGQLLNPIQATNSSPFVQLWQPYQQIIRFKSKYISKSARKRQPLSTKRAGKGYYKGNGSTKEGKVNSKGRFISDPKLKLQLVVPDLGNFKVSLFIWRQIYDYVLFIWLHFVPPQNNNSKTHIIL